MNQINFNMNPYTLRNVIIAATIVMFSFVTACKKENNNLVPVSNDLTGLTFSRIIGDYPDYKIAGNIVSFQEIISYDSTAHVFLLASSAADRIKAESYSVAPLKFALGLDGEIIYIASFLPMYSSISCSDCIVVDPYSPNNMFPFKLGYPGEEYFSGTDPRNDLRIISRLKLENKLTE